jgi:hypothetical protein
MGNQDLQGLLDKIEIDSMERDRIFHLGKGKEQDEERKEFFKLVRGVKHYMDYYLEYEEETMDRNK